MAERDRRIQEIAYLLWEQEGRPDGQAERFWHAAEVQFETEQARTEQDEKLAPPPDEGAAAEAAEVEADAAVVEAETSHGLQPDGGERYAVEPEAPKKRVPAKAKAATAGADKSAPAVKAKPGSAKPKAADAPAVTAKTVESPPAKPRAAAAKRKPLA